MLRARADLFLQGPGVAVRLRGDGRVLIADVTGEARATVRYIRSAARIVRIARATSRALRRSGLSLHVRVGGRTLVRLG